MNEQLDLFHQPDEPPVPAPLEEAATICANNCADPRRTQLSELPGTTWEDMFEGPPSRSRSAA